jgi:hypothetical protein
MERPTTAFQNTSTLRVGRRHEGLLPTERGNGESVMVRRRMSGRTGLWLGPGLAAVDGVEDGVRHGSVTANPLAD